MCVDENERLDIPPRERPLMRHVHNIAVNTVENSVLQTNSGKRMMSAEPAKAAIIPLHEPFILASEDGQWHQTLCGTLGCGYESPEFDGRRYLAEIAADEHIRARASWPKEMREPT